MMKTWFLAASLVVVGCGHISDGSHAQLASTKLEFTESRHKHHITDYALLGENLHSSMIYPESPERFGYKRCWKSVTVCHFDFVIDHGTRNGKTQIYNIRPGIRVQMFLSPNLDKEDANGASNLPGDSEYEKAANLEQELYRYCGERAIYWADRFKRQYKNKLINESWVAFKKWTDGQDSRDRSLEAKRAFAQGKRDGLFCQ